MQLTESRLCLALAALLCLARAQESAPRPGAILADPACKEIRTVCRDLTEDLDILECLQTASNDVLRNLGKQCQHSIWNRIQSLMQKDEIKRIIDNACDKDFTKCNDVLDKNYLSCVFDYKDDIDDEKCVKMVKKLEIVAFSDSKWLSTLIEDCSNDIEDLQCGRLETSHEVFSQASTISCLQNKLTELSPTCRAQLFKITEIQADSFILDKDLYMSCAEDFFRYCKSFKMGTGSAVKCLIQHKNEKMSQDCQEQLFRREKMIVQDFKISKKLTRACKADIKRSGCQKQMLDDKGVRLAKMLLCLEGFSKTANLSSACQLEMIDHRRILMEDYRLSPEIVSKCSKDIKSLCKIALNGKTIHCLMDHVKGSPKITDECLRAVEALVKQTDVGEDWRVDPVLHEACHSVVDMACSGLRGGEARVMSCLMDNIGMEGMNAECENALVQIQYFVARDFRLDPALYKDCRNDAVKLCHAKNNWVSGHDDFEPDTAPLVLPCLYRYAYNTGDKDLILSQRCFEQIKRVMRQRAVSVDLLPEIEDVCLDDLANHCHLLIHKGEETLCLQRHLDELKDNCKKAVSNYTENLSRHAELNPLILKHCLDISEKYCKNELSTRNNEGALMECLIAHKNTPDMKMKIKCRAVVEQYQLVSMKNYNLSYKFKAMCKNQVAHFCRGVKTKADVIECLSEIVRDDILEDAKSKIPRECRQQLRLQLLQQRENIAYDPKLKIACEKDIATHCHDIVPGSSAVLECLQTTPNKLEPSCQRAIYKIKYLELNDNTIDYTLVNVCKDMINKHCSQHPPSHVLDCLKAYKEESAFNQKCKLVVIHRLIEQSTDYRFNPSLQAACDTEITAHCSDIIKGGSKDTELNGRVVQCLKVQFKESNLSDKCQKEMVVVLRDQALNYRLDPVIRAMCENDIRLLCGKYQGDEENADGGTEECLKNQFLQQKALTPECHREVGLLIEGSRADINTDPWLHKACSQDLLEHCRDVPQGQGRQIRCLLELLENYTYSLESNCRDTLKKRLEMYKMAQAPESLQQLYSQVVASPAKRFFSFVAFTCIGMIFFIGIFCGRVTKRHMVLKNK